MNGLKYIRNLCNITLNELAEKLSVSRQAISMWERDDEKRKPIPKKRLTQLSKFFGIPEEYFGDLNQMQKNTIDKKRIFRKYKQNEKSIYLADEKPAVDKDEMLVELIGFNIDFYEEYNKLSKDVKTLMNEITDFILSKGEDVGIHDQLNKMHRMLMSYNAMFNVVKASKGLIYTSMIYQVLKALEISFDVCDVNQYDLEVKDIHCPYASEWTYKIAQTIQEEMGRLKQERKDRIKKAVEEKNQDK